jgi:hypothetical protein
LDDETVMSGNFPSRLPPGRHPYELEPFVPTSTLFVVLDTNDAKKRPVKPRGRRIDQSGLPETSARTLCALSGLANRSLTNATAGNALCDAEVDEWSEFLPTGWWFLVRVGEVGHHR